MSTKVLNYCAVVIGGVSSPEMADPDNDALLRLSSIEANWNTGFQLWDDGDDKYVFWGDINGEIQLFDLILTASTAADATKVVANWSAPQTITIHQGTVDAPNPVVVFTDMCYSMDVTSKRLRPFGDRYVIEGATRFQIWS